MTSYEQFNWAVTDTWNFEEETSINFYELENDKDYARTWLKEGHVNTTYLWKLTTGNPIKWMEVS